MFKKVVLGALICATSMFGMSLTQLNSANKADLMKINGIGAVKAAAILKERKKGKFTSFKDLTRVDGIGVQTAANLKDDVTSAKGVKKVKKSASKKVKKSASKKVKKSTSKKVAKKVSSKKSAKDMKKVT